MLGSVSKKLIIVINEKTATYGELLSALISAKDDQHTEDENTVVVGVPDGSVETAIWTDKVYLDNQSQLASNNKVLFIGKSDSAKTVAANIYTENPFYEYGIRYGSLGNKAVIYVEGKGLMNNRDLYEKFYAQYNDLIGSTNADYSDSLSDEKAEAVEDRIKEESDKAAGEISSAVNKGISFINKGLGRIGKKSNDDERKKTIKLPSISRELANTAVNAVATVITGGGNIGLAKAKSDKEILDQQYRCAVIAYYFNELRSFMER